MMKRWRREKRLIGLGLILIVMAAAGCGTMNSATVDLSNEITARIKDIERSHIGAVNTLFDREQQRVDNFMAEKWIPLFLRNYLGTSQILKDLQKNISIGSYTMNQLAVVAQEYLSDPSEGQKMAKKIVTALNEKRHNEDATLRTIINDYIPDDKQEAAAIHMSAILNLETPAVLIMEFAEAANEEIAAQRQYLLKPIEAARVQTMAELSKAYADIYAGQGVITARLEAAVRKNQQQANLLDAVGGKGTAAKINANLTDFSRDMQGIFKHIEEVYSEIDARENGSGDEAGDLMKILKEEIEKALIDSGLAKPKL